MARRRFYAAPASFDSRASSVTLAPDEARHLREVLRLKVGDEAFVFNGKGQEFRCVVEESRRDSARLKVQEELEPSRPESPLQLTLAVALLKGEKFDLVVQKATELGVTRIVPIITKLADIRLRDEADAKKRVTRWQRIALEAAKQCGRAAIPAIETPITFDEFTIEVEAGKANTSLLFSERGGRPLQETLAPLAQPLTSLSALVGSEGGWTDEELAAAEQRGWLLVTLGGRTLRAETAGITVAALLQHLAGDLR